MILLLQHIGTTDLSIFVSQSYGTPYLLSLDLSKELTALVWLAGPLSGLLVQPVNIYVIGSSNIFMLITDLFISRVILF